MRLIFSVMLAMYATSHFVTPIESHKLLSIPELVVTNYAKQSISALRNLLRCMENCMPHQVTLFLFEDLPPPWSIAASAHEATFPVIMGHSGAPRGSINVLVPLPGAGNLSAFAIDFALRPSVNPNRAFIIVYLNNCRGFQLKTLHDISREFYLKLGTSRVIHLCPDSDPFVYFSESPHPARTQWPLAAHSVTDFCSEQSAGFAGKMPLDFGLGHLKGFRFEFIIREHHMWIDRRGRKRFGGRDVQLAQLLTDYGMVWIDCTQRPDVKNLPRMDFELFMPTRRFSSVTDSKHQGVERIIIIEQSDEFLVVRKAQRIPFGLVLLLPFAWESWSSLGAAFLLVVVAWALVRIHPVLTFNVVSSFFEMTEVLITGCSSRTVRWDSQRIITLCAIFFHMIAGNVYSGLLFGFITKPQYMRELETVKDVVAATDRLYVTESYNDVSGILDNLGKLKENLIIIKNVSERDTCVSDIVTTGKAATCMNVHIYSVVSRYRKYTEEGRILLHKVKEPLLSPSYAGYLVPRNHFIFPVFQNLILRLWQSGLFNQWNAMLSHSLDLDGQRAPANVRGGERSYALRINQLSGPFFLHFGGLCLAAVAFALECSVGRRAVHREDGRLYHESGGY